jgi:hypothetical protein
VGSHYPLVQRNSTFKRAFTAAQNFINDVRVSNASQLLHGSEFAIWSDAAMHLAGIGNTTEKAPGIKIILKPPRTALATCRKKGVSKANRGYRRGYKMIF